LTALTVEGMLATMTHRVAHRCLLGLSGANPACAAKAWPGDRDEGQLGSPQRSRLIEAPYSPDFNPIGKPGQRVASGKDATPSHSSWLGSDNAAMTYTDGDNDPVVKKLKVISMAIFRRSNNA
jgi:hypothetical protein